MRLKLASLSLAGALLLSGCFLSPTGANRSTSAIPVAESGKVVLPFVPVGEPQPTKVTMTVQDNDTVTAFDDSVDDGFKVELDVSKLAPGVYTANVSLDAEAPSAQLVFIVPDPNAGQTPAAGEAAGETGTEPAAGEAPAEEAPAEEAAPAGS
jgi:hypothetical protein